MRRGPDGFGKDTVGTASAVSLAVPSSRRYCATCSSPRHTTQTNWPSIDCTSPCAFLPATCESLGSASLPPSVTGITATVPAAVLELAVSSVLPLRLGTTETVLPPPDQT